MESGGSMPKSQGLSKNPYPEPHELNSSYCHLFLILILYSHLWSGLPEVLIPAGLSVKILKTFPSSSILAKWAPHLNLVDFFTLVYIKWTYKIRSFSLWNLLHSLFPSFLGSKIRLRILFLNTFSLDFSQQPWITDIVTYFSNQLNYEDDVKL